MRHRIAAFLGEAPVLFIGIVLGIAVLFRVAIGAVRPATAEAGAVTETETPAPRGARGEAPGLLGPEGATARSAAAPGAPAAQSPSKPDSPLGTASVAPGDARRGPLPAPPRRKHRAHGRRGGGERERGAPSAIEPRERPGRVD